MEAQDEELVEAPAETTAADFGRPWEPAEVAAEESRSRRRSYYPEPCPSCGNATLRRVRLPLRYKPLRWLGLDVRAFRCSTCKRRLISGRRGKSR